MITMLLEYKTNKLSPHSSFTRALFSPINVYATYRIIIIIDFTFFRTFYVFLAPAFFEMTIKCFQIMSDKKSFLNNYSVRFRINQ